ncbi:uncharacterized protein LY89DRAFT_756449 [Mollisia scopiformis]|uniref:Uncharacterized protein n=1 Tax=Mollisia scopiformis TaxID=149040 RepID=A0A194WYP7_MOLSC|nr:uncharacterized protein LY89DRAFT_756449 [Mollisia scopiformis]KUJ13083.1 hypothetical protein LY89DRAFT_756449 [Mollisia scopiformis]
MATTSSSGRSNPYENIHVHISWWNKDQMGVPPEIVELEQVFREKYNFRTRVHRLGWSDESRAVVDLDSGLEYHDNLDVVKSVLDSSSLLIFYYSGRVRSNAAGDLMLLPRVGEQGEEIAWTYILKQLMKLYSDVLIIWDTDHTSRACIQAMYTMEFIGAADNSREMWGPTTLFSFTQFLIDVLREAAKNDDGLTAADLHSRIVSRYLDAGLVIKKEKGQESNCPPLPFYFKPRGSVVFGSIPIIKLPVEDEDEDMSHSNASPSSGSDIDSDDDDEDTSSDKGVEAIKRDLLKRPAKRAVAQRKKLLTTLKERAQRPERKRHVPIQRGGLCLPG